MNKLLFCRKHFRRPVAYVPMLMPTMTVERLGCVVKHRKDLIYIPKCPICWDQGERNAAFAEYQKRWF